MIPSVRRRVLAPATIGSGGGVTTIPAGTTGAVAVDAFGFLLAPGTVWNIYLTGSSTPIADDGTPNGWNVVYAGGILYNVTVPVGAMSSTGLAYHFVITPSHTGHTSDVGHFDVL